MSEFRSQRSEIDGSQPCGASTIHLGNNHHDIQAPAVPLTTLAESSIVHASTDRGGNSHTATGGGAEKTGITGTEGSSDSEEHDQLNSVQDLNLNSDLHLNASGPFPDDPSSMDPFHGHGRFLQQAPGAVTHGRSQQQHHGRSQHGNMDPTITAAAAVAWSASSFTQLLCSVSPAYQLRRNIHQEHVMTNDDPEAGSSSTSHINHGDPEENLTPGMTPGMTPGTEWVEEQQQQPTSASMLVQQYQNLGVLPPGREVFFSAFAQNHHPMSLHPTTNSRCHNPAPCLTGEPFRPAVFSRTAAQELLEAACIPFGAPQNVFSGTVASHELLEAAPSPFEASPDALPDAAASHELLAASAAASGHHSAALVPASAFPASALPALFQPGPMVSSAAATMRPIGQMDSSVGVGCTSAAPSRAILYLPGRPCPPPLPVITHTWAGRTLPQPAASACSPAATAFSPAATAFSPAVSGAPAAAPGSPVAALGPRRHSFLPVPGRASFEDDSVSASSSVPYPGIAWDDVVVAGCGAASGHGGLVAAAAAAAAGTAVAAAREEDMAASYGDAVGMDYGNAGDVDVASVADGADGADGADSTASASTNEHGSTSQSESDAQ
ncbi:hypothetical protein CLOM_g7831 [Closterium sp. NIES-68]|nr:hypothetical protein CLOM_g3890 [Closterium sp. NIES-68]GJP48543.1 hypothetical protein CLOM_g7831 [Closterium sp. NIES-68]GJP66825.1 hypothetical protein CLOP_g23718 [Closterium sp. NIES-67]